MAISGNFSSNIVKKEMLEIRPVCENCGKALPNHSQEAMICSFECTFCKKCADEILNNVCPNCGGGFEKRPVRPAQCVTVFCLEKYPASIFPKIKRVDPDTFNQLRKHYLNIPPEKR